MLAVERKINAGRVNSRPDFLRKVSKEIKRIGVEACVEDMRKNRPNNFDRMLIELVKVDANWLLKQYEVESNVKRDVLGAVLANINPSKLANNCEQLPGSAINCEQVANNSELSGDNGNYSRLWDGVALPDEVA